MTNIPTYQEQTNLAIACEGPAVIDGRTYTVTRVGASLRFHAAPRHTHDVPASAHVGVLRADLAHVEVQLGGYADRALEAACLAVVTARLAAVRA